MSEDRVVLRLGHSPDPDDVFMWWPITGKVTREADGRAGDAVVQVSPPVIDCGRYEFRAVPRDIEVLNRRAADAGDLEITALSVRAWNDVSERYRLTRCGSSFGDGYGPKIVARGELSVEDLRREGVRIAVPGRRTTAFLVMSLMLGETRAEIVEMPFDAVITAVSKGEADAGLLIHEGQVTYAAAGLRLIVDLGAWWKSEHGLPLPLGVNAVQRDIDERLGAGSLIEIASLLRQSLAWGLEHREESLDYAMTFALTSPDGGVITRARVDAYIDMYVNGWTVDMGEAGMRAIEAVLGAGAEKGLCRVPTLVDAI